jgi:hypothetical protein
MDLHSTIKSSKISIILKMGNGAMGIGHWVLGIGHWALGFSAFPFPLSPS